MRKATINSVCECQAKLYAELDEHQHVHRGWARDSKGNTTEAAPAHRIDLPGDAFSVGWFCPFCIRNTLRRFDATMLTWEPSPAVGEGATPANSEAHTELPTSS